MKPFETVAELEDALCKPTEGVVEALRSIEGDIMVLGAGGKMGPTVARMARRAFDELGQPHRKVFAVSRFSSPGNAEELQRCGIETVVCDLLDRNAVQALPDVPNILFMAGQKFGTRDAPDLTWVMNTLVPAVVAERFAHSRIVVFSTGCVYPFVSIAGPGADEDHPLGPPGEYSNSCVGRERVFEHFARRNGTPLLFFRLCYAIDMRYGVLMDVAQKVAQGLPVDVTMGWANVIWQGDASARALQCLTRTASPPVALNVTGQERISIRALAYRLGELFDRAPVISGEEGPIAWLWDASRSYEWFGPPSVTLAEMIEATVHWIRIGGPTLGKPTHFEARDGEF